MQPEKVMHIMCMASFIYMKPFKTYNEQIELLKSRKLLPVHRSHPKINALTFYDINNKSGKMLFFPLDFQQIRRMYIDNNIFLFKKCNLLLPLNNKKLKAYNAERAYLNIRNKKVFLPMSQQQMRECYINELIKLTKKHSIFSSMRKPKITTPHRYIKKYPNDKPILMPTRSDQIREGWLRNPNDFVEEILQTYGYYNIVNQYNKPFLKADGTYQNHIDFFKLYSLQQIDTEMKNIMFYPILQIEQRLKICISYEFAKAYGPFEGEDMSNYIEPYFKEGNFNRSLTNRKKEPKYKLVIEQLKKIYKDQEYKPFKHYKNKHKHIPIWIFMNKLMFGQMRHFYDVLKIQPNIAKKFKLTPSQLRTMMLFLNQVRNDCAHFSGFYNQIYPKIKDDLPLLNDFQHEFKFTSQSSIPNIFLLLIIFKYLLSKDDYPNFLLAIKNRVFVLVFRKYIPIISEYMQDKLSIKTKEEYERKLTFLKEYIIK